MYGRSHYRMMGDPLFGGLFRRIGRGLGRVARFGGRFLPGPLGSVAAALSGGQPGCPSHGDPQLGGLLGRIGAAAVPVLQRITGAAQRIGTAIGAPQLPSVIRQATANPLLRQAAAGAAFAGGGALLGRMLRGGGGGEGRRYRRMNVANVRALRRSIRRVKGFAKIARETVRMSSTVRMRKGKKRA